MADGATIQVNVDRPSRPTIWLDTNVLIEIAKTEAGKIAHVRAGDIGKQWQRRLARGAYCAWTLSSDGR